MVKIIKIRESNEAEVILEFLKGEINSNRFSENLNGVLKELNLDERIITCADLNNKEENIRRLEIMHKFRGYPNEDMFNNFPKITRWELCTFDSLDLDNCYFIDYDYWNELSNNTSLPKEAAKNVLKGVEVYDVSNEQYIAAKKYLENGGEFPPVITITSNEKKYLIIEGHLRMTAYALYSNFSQAKMFVGYTTDEEMKNYDKRMI